MDENTSLVNIGELSKPATVLVEKISEAVGGIFKPYQIVRVAKAEAQADRLRAEGRIEISDLQRKAFHRFLNEEASKQKNIEEITQKALPLLKEDSRPAEIEIDWLVSFFDRCRLISNDEMQSLWSRVLAGEANSPASYSKRTLSFLTGLDKREADTFTRLCGFAWDIGGLVPFIYLGHPDFSFPDIYEKNQINERGLSDLESIGLIQLTDGRFEVRVPRKRASYFDRQVSLRLRDSDKIVLPIGRVRLTKVGKELAPICGAEPVEGFFESCITNWKLNYSIEVAEL